MVTDEKPANRKPHSTASMRRRYVAAAGACVVVVGGAIAIGSAGAATTAQRVSGFGQRNAEYLAVDVSIANGAATGIVAFGFLDGSVTCTYRTFTDPQITGTVVSFRGTGHCTYTSPGYSHVFAHHRFRINTGAAGSDIIDVNSLPNSSAGITIPGGHITGGNYTLH